MPRPLTTELLLTEAKAFAGAESLHLEKSLFGVTDGKAVGTYLEHKFLLHLQTSFSFDAGNSAKGIDLPGLGVDLKVTSVTQPQSSCPFKSARQKIYGLGYALLVFVYEKKDDTKARAARLKIRHTVFVEEARTADFQTTSGLRRLIDNSANEDDIVAFLEERMLPIDEIGIRSLAQEILRKPPEVGYLTISNALQWRLQYSRVIDQAGQTSGIHRLL